MSLRSTGAASSILTLLAAGALLWTRAPINDVAWQLWVGRQIVHGAHLYTDIVEVNPPLWFWMAVPVVRFAAMAGLTEYHALVIVFLAFTACSMTLVGMMARGIYGTIVSGVCIPVVALLLLVDIFGQREHIALVASLPYIFLIVRRAEGREAGWSIAAWIGVFAAVGLALKPHFLIVPLMLELWLCLRTRRVSVRPETAALAACLVIYGAAILLLAPDYLADMVPMARLAYTGYDQPILYQLGQPIGLMAGLCLLGSILYGLPKANAAQALAVAGVGFLLAYLLQQKGWRYHGAPALGLFLLAMISEAPMFRWRTASVSQRASQILFALAAACPVIGLSRALAVPGNDSARRATATMRAGDTVMVLSTSGGRFWPLPVERGFLWPSSYMTYWMLLAVSDEMQRPNPRPEILRLAARVRERATHDLSCHPPGMILVDRYNESSLVPGLLPFFKGDPGFAALMSSYRRGPDFGEFSTYSRVRPIGLKPQGCRTIY